MVLQFAPAANYNSPLCSPDDFNRLRKFTYRKLQCGQGAREARLCYHLAVKKYHSFDSNGLQSCLWSSQQHRRIYDPLRVFRRNAAMRRGRRISTFVLQICCQICHRVDSDRLQSFLSAPKVPGRIYGSGPHFRPNAECRSGAASTRLNTPPRLRLECVWGGSPPPGGVL